MEMADRYVRFLRLPPPQGKTCREFDPHEFQHTHRKEVSDKSWEQIRESRERRLLFPLPTRGAGRLADQFIKPRDYLDAAWFYSRSEVSLDKYCYLLEMLEDRVSAQVDMTIGWLKTKPEICEKVRTLMLRCKDIREAEWVYSPPQFPMRREFFNK